ncbi:MAG: hypothetical protein D6772_11885, partial [Bacteroidetes bacterium]
RIISAQAACDLSLLQDTSLHRPKGQLRFMHRSLRGDIFLSLSDLPGLLQLEAHGDRLVRYPKVPDSLEYGGIFEDLQGNLLVNVSRFSARYPSNEDWYFLHANGQVSHFSHLRAVGGFVTAVASRDFLQDILFGLDTGLKIVRNSASKVEKILYQELKPDERGYSMRSIVADTAGYLYLAREIKHWYRYDKRTGVLDTLSLYDAHGDYLDFNYCQGFVYDPRGYLWGFTSNGTDKGLGMVHRFDLESCLNTIYTVPDYIQAYTPLVDGKIWLATYRTNQTGYLLTFDTLTKSFEPFYDAQGENPFQRVFIRYLLPSKHWKDVLWVGSEQGLFRLNTATRTYTYYYGPSGSNRPNGQRVNLRSNTVYALYEDEAQQLWVGTKNGLHRFDPRSNTWKAYMLSNDVTSNTVACIVPDTESNGLWISTYNGLAFLEPEHPDEIRRFTRIDGFAHSEFNRFSCYRDDESGKIYLGGMNGVSAFYPRDLLVQAEVPKPLLASFSYYDGRKDTLITRIANLHDGVYLSVEPHYDYFNFNFTLPVYTPSTENQFRYRIGDDPEQEWIYLKNSRSLSYSNMKKGNYTFYVQGADPNGNWSEQALLIHLRVREFFWRSPAFVFLLVGLGGLVAFWFYRDRVERRLSMERLRTELATNLHDEVSGLLAGISLQSEILREQTDDEQLSTKLKRIWAASQGAMSKMSDVIWSIDARRDHVANLITRMEEHADEVLLPLGIRYQIKTYDLDLQQAMPATIRQELYFIYKEAINNVAKHAKTNRVEVALGHTDKYFELLIKDNGSAAHLPKEQPVGRRQRKGQGMTNLRLRAERLKAELTILRGRGYTIHLRMKRFIK